MEVTDRAGLPLIRYFLVYRSWKQWMKSMPKLMEQSFQFPMI